MFLNLTNSSLRFNFRFKIWQVKIRLAYIVAKWQMWNFFLTQVILGKQCFSNYHSYFCHKSAFGILEICSCQCHHFLWNIIMIFLKRYLKKSITLKFSVISLHWSLAFYCRNFKISNNKGNAKIKFHRDYSSFQMEHFKAELDHNLKSSTGFEYSKFQNTYNRILPKHASLKKKFIRLNNSAFMTKTLEKP